LRPQELLKQLVALQTRSSKLLLHTEVKKPSNYERDCIKFDIPKFGLINYYVYWNYIEKPLAYIRNCIVLYVILMLLLFRYLYGDRIMG